MSKTWGFYFGGSGHGLKSSRQISAYYKFFPGKTYFYRTILWCTLLLKKKKANICTSGLGESGRRTRSAKTGLFDQNPNVWSPYWARSGFQVFNNNYDSSQSNIKYFTHHSSKHWNLLLQFSALKFITRFNIKHKAKTIENITWRLVKLLLTLSKVSSLTKRLVMFAIVLAFTLKIFRCFKYYWIISIIQLTPEDSAKVETDCTAFNIFIWGVLNIWWNWITELKLLHFIKVICHPWSNCLMYGYIIQYFID